MVSSASESFNYSLFATPYSPLSLLMIVIMVVRMRVPAVRPSQHVAALSLVGPVFPGPPGLGRIGAVAGVARIDFALREIFDFAAQHLGAHQCTRIARQVDRHAHHFDDRPRRRRKTVPAHQRNAVAAEAFREIAAL